MSIKQEIQELGQGRISKLLIKFSFPYVMGFLINPGAGPASHSHAYHSFL